MKVKNVNVYSFEELSEKAKQKAMDHWRQGEQYPFFDDALLCLKTFVGHFGGSVLNYSIGDGRDTFVKTDLKPANFRGRKLKDFDPNHMPTGIWLDGGLWNEFFHEFRKTGDSFYAYQMAIEQFLIDVRNDVEHYFSDEQVIETFEINEYEFNPDGSFFFGEVANA